VIIEAVTVTRYRVANAPARWRRRRLRSVKRLAYRDAAWAKIQTHCWCTFPDSETDPPRTLCKYHDKDYRAADVPSRNHWEEPDWHGFLAPTEWRLPRSDEPGLWDYGRAVAHRLARFYAHCDRGANHA
jgi:hypothetical protein